MFNTKSMESKPEKKKGPWYLARERVQEAALKQAKSMGYNHVTTTLISPKTLRDNPDHVLMMSYEFTGKHVFILFDKDWNDLVDLNNNVTGELVLYTIPTCKNYQEVYTSAELHADGPYIVELNELKPLVARPGFAPKIEASIPADLEYPYVDDDQDEHLSAMTIRDFYSIMKEKPVSNKSWLNTLIKQNK